LFVNTKVAVVVGGLAGVALTALAVASYTAQSVAADALLHPFHRPMLDPAPAGCEATTFDGFHVTLSGWRCRPAGQAPRATVVLLHGVADNRAGWRPTIERFEQQGFEVIAYDSRAHGQSTGDACTYGFFEKQDLHRVLDAVQPKRVVLVGTSLGAAIALQEAAGDPRVSAVVAAETFSDLRTVAAERVPYLPKPIVERAFETAEARASFVADDVSPLRAASRITAPVLLIHGADDVETVADHSRRVYTALAGPKRLLIVPGGHNHSLGSAKVWTEIDSWIEQALQSESGPNRFAM
jgi:alpha-beta hydrolase superfamily lysophospholipase